MIIKGYDGVFIQENILENITCRDKPPRIIKQGTKILCLEYKKVKIIDSLSFLPIPLASFPKTFGILEKRKGFYPHRFNLPENQEYIGKLPCKDDYGIKFMNSEKKEEFENWYKQNETKVFNQKKELLAYCISDVDLLTEGCLEFRKIIIKLTNCDPYKNNIKMPINSVSKPSICLNKITCSVIN